ncbi:MAG: 50S ribosomal protein L10 [Oligoflexales bacterium]
MARLKSSKIEIAQNLAEKMSKASASVVAEYRGMSANELAELRNQLQEVEAEFKIANNRVTREAISQSESAEKWDALRDQLKGPIGVAYIYGDIAAASKVLVKADGDFPNFKVSGGVLEGRGVSLEELKAISDLPSKEVLLGQIVGSIVSPHRGLLGVLNGVARNLVQVVGAIKDKKTN